MRSRSKGLSRRGVLRRAGGLLAVSALPSAVNVHAAVQSPGRPPASTRDITGTLARYMAGARDRRLPPDVIVATKHRVLDTFAAMVSGAALPPGEMAIKYVRAQGGASEASVVATNIRTSAINAALANGMLAHADDTDDFEPVTKAHPGCAVVAAALAMAEREGRSGVE